MKSIRLTRLSPTVNVVDCSRLVSAYLETIGHQGCVIGSATVWTCRIGQTTVAVDATPQQALEKAMEMQNSAPIQPSGNDGSNPVLQTSGMVANLK
jgi:hypothetical protein